MSIPSQKERTEGLGRDSCHSIKDFLSIESISEDRELGSICFDSDVESESSNDDDSLCSFGIDDDHCLGTDSEEEAEIFYHFSLSRLDSLKNIKGRGRREVKSIFSANEEESRRCAMLKQSDSLRDVTGKGTRVVKSRPVSKMTSCSNDPLRTRFRGSPKRRLDRSLLGTFAKQETTVDIDTILSLSDSMHKMNTKGRRMVSTAPAPPTKPDFELVPRCA